MFVGNFCMDRFSSSGVTLLVVESYLAAGQIDFQYT